MDKFLEKYNLLKLLREQIGNDSQKNLKKINQLFKIVPYGEWREGAVREFEMDTYILLYLKWIIN